MTVMLDVRPPNGAFARMSSRRRPCAPARSARARVRGISQARESSGDGLLQAAWRYHKLLSLTPAQAARGVVAASSGGNHALAVAAAAARLGIAAEVFIHRR